jgi:hypothetical protein
MGAIMMVKDKLGKAADIKPILDHGTTAGLKEIASFPGPCCVWRDPAEPCPAVLIKV